MKNLYSSLIAIVALAVFDSVAAAAPIPTWGQQINGPGRFTVLARFSGDAVLDKETGLVWEQSPGMALQTWTQARFACAPKNVGGRLGWRLPSFHELASLVDPTQMFAPALPPGHPFSNVQPDRDYWSATTDAVSPINSAWIVHFGGGGGGIDNNNKGSSLSVW